MEKTSLSNITAIPNDDCKSTLYEIMGLGASIKNESCSIALTEIESGGYVIRHKHIQSEETYVFTKGSAEMIINGSIIQVSAGDTVIIHVNDVHELSTSSSEGVEFYAITIPPFNADDFIVV